MKTWRPLREPGPPCGFRFWTPDPWAKLPVEAGVGTEVIRVDIEAVCWGVGDTTPTFTDDELVFAMALVADNCELPSA